MIHFWSGNLLANLLTIGVYLLESYAIYRLAVVRGLPNPIFAFIPFFQLFILGQIGDSMKYLNTQINSLLGNIPLAYALPLLSIAGSFFRYPLSVMCALLVSIGTLLVYYLVFFFYARKTCVLFTVIACLPTVVMVLAIFSMLPMVGRAFGFLAGILSIATVIAPVAGPLLVLYSIRGYRHYR